MKKRSLKLSYNIDFELIGIVTPLQEYKLAHHLNLYLKLELKRIEDWQVNLGAKKNSGAFFKQYFYKNDITRCAFYLLQNKSLSEVCLPEFSIIDYLLLIFGESNDNLINDFLSIIKQLPGVSSSLLLDTTKIKNIENILIDEAIF